MHPRGVSFRQSHLNLCVVLASYLTDLLSENDRDIRVTENLRLKKQMEERIALADVVTQNAEMLKILRLVEKINRSNLTVLLQGETGTGKTLIARAVHLSSPRAQGPFVTVACPAAIVPESAQLTVFALVPLAIAESVQPVRSTGFGPEL